MKTILLVFGMLDTPWADGEPFAVLRELLSLENA